MKAIKGSSVLSRYGLPASAILHLICNMKYRLLRGLKIAAALRYDYYHYNFENSCTSSIPVRLFKNNFNRFSPKVGATYNYRNVGVYAITAKVCTTTDQRTVYRCKNCLSGVRRHSGKIGRLVLYHSGIHLYADWAHFFEWPPMRSFLSKPDGSTENKNAGKPNIPVLNMASPGNHLVCNTGTFQCSQQ